MAAPRKRYAKKATVYDETEAGKVASGVEFTFSNGSAIVVALDEFPDAIRLEAMAHGFRQKIGDAWNKAESAAEAHGIGLAMVERLKAGDWRAETGGGFGIADEWLVKAVAELKGKELDEIRVTWDSLSPEAKEAVRKDPRTKATAERIRAEAKAQSAPATKDDPLAAF